MGQVFRQTISPGAAGFASPTLGVRERCSVAYREIGGTTGATITLRGHDGDSIDTIAASGSGLVRDKNLKQILVSGNGAQVVVDARTEPEHIEPTYLTGVVSNTQVAVTSSSGGQPPNTSTSALTFGASGSPNTQNYAFAPPLGYRWRIWGIGVVLGNSNPSDGLVLSAWWLTLYSTVAAILGTGVLWTGSSGPWTIPASGTGAFAVLPTGTTMTSGASIMSYVAGFPFEVIVVPGDSFQVSFIGQSSGALGIDTTLNVVPLGVQEPL